MRAVAAMSDRRSHWDDDLITAVSDASELPYHDEMVFAVIAAVEDWIEQQPITRSPHVADADAKIQAVRDMPEKPSDHWRGFDFAEGWNACRGSMLAILDGDSDE